MTKDQKIKTTITKDANLLKKIAELEEKNNSLLDNLSRSLADYSNLEKRN